MPTVRPAPSPLHLRRRRLVDRLPDTHAPVRVADAPSRSLLSSSRSALIRSECAACWRARSAAACVSDCVSMASPSSSAASPE